MCQFFIISSAEKVDIAPHLRLLFEKGRIHKHGWGLARFTEDGTQIIKEPIPAPNSESLKLLLKDPIYEKTAFAHVRYATVGDVIIENCHPFKEKDINGRVWTLMHKGTLFDFEPTRKYFHVQSGSTDSERILLYLVDRISVAEKEKGGRLNFDERFSLLDAQMRLMAVGNRINLAIHDGEIIYLHSNFENALYQSRVNNSLSFCSEPLTESDPWEKVPLNTLIAIKNGEIIKRGTSHGITYIDTKDDMRRLYEIYANL
ncbi:MAG: class II glutamine amidotransferase [Lachnospiraceae bacterium]|jgi:glutamine amidotransferase|nr:class II glutamine amidotransferase [Lachnospiraceae bacterium]